MKTTEIATRLEEYAEWAEANSYEVPIMLPDTLREAKALIEKSGTASILFSLLLSLNYGNSLNANERVRCAVRQYRQFMEAMSEFKEDAQ